MFYLSITVASSHEATKYHAAKWAYDNDLYEDALRLTKQLSSMDDYGARWLLGLMHFYGLGTPENVDKAVEHWKISAQNDNTMAKRYLCAHFVYAAEPALQTSFETYRSQTLANDTVNWCWKAILGGHWPPAVLLARHFTNLGEYYKAEILLEKYLPKIADSYFKRDWLKFGLDHLATIYSQTNRTLEARDIRQLIVDIDKDLMEDDPYEYATSLVNLSIDQSIGGDPLGAEESLL